MNAGPDQASNMQQHQRKPLKVQLKPKEMGLYSLMFQQADVKGNQKVEGAEAVNFFRKSGLANDKLKAIWLMAARTSNQHLTREEFYIALRLIAYEQNGMAADENAIELNLEVDLPRFDGGGIIPKPAPSPGV